MLALVACDSLLIQRMERIRRPVVDVMRSRLTAALLLAACAGAPVLVHAQINASIEAVARKEATAAIEKSGAFSVTTAVLIDGSIVYAEAFGRIGSDGNLRPDTRTQFNAGSISKVFAAVAILRLRDQGRVDLDRPVVHYLPQFRMNDPRYRQITVRMLLDHTAGLPGTNYYDLFASDDNAGYVPQTLALLRESALKSRPGDSNVYCNDCFTLAQAVVERISGMAFADFVMREIFAPAAMDDSSYGFKDGNRNVAAAYAPGAQGALLPPEIVNAFGSGGLTTTAVDLCHFARALMDGELLRPGSMIALQLPQPGRLGGGYSLAYAGLGWDSVAEPDFAAKGIRVLGKDGFTNYFKSQMYVAPGQRVAVATILAGPATTPGSVVIDMSKRIMWAALANAGRLRDTSGSTIALPPPAVIPEAMLRYAGVYAGFGHATFRLTFDRAANALDTARLVDGEFVPGAAFKYRADGRFYAPDNQGFSFQRSANGRNILMQHVDNRGGKTTIAEAVTPDLRADTSEFEGMTWVPQNLRADDFVTLLFGGLYKTGTIPAVPGIVYLHAGNPGDAVPYGLADKFRSRFILQFEADLQALEIVPEEGGKTLRMGAFVYADAATVPPLQNVERLEIGARGRNIVRKVTSAGAFTSDMASNARILIYGPDGTIAFDTLVGGAGPFAVEPGSFVVFIGEPGTVFVPRIA